MEADLGVFYNKFPGGRSQTHLILGECKSGFTAEDKDIDKMVELGKEFPGAVIMFATTADNFADFVIKKLKKVVDENRIKMAKKKPFNRILILTENELFSLLPWQYEASLQDYIVQHEKMDDELLHLCEVTQQAYLGVESKYDFWDRWNKAAMEKSASKSSNS